MNLKLITRKYSLFILLLVALALFIAAVMTVDWYAADTCSGLHVSGGDCIEMIGDRK